MSQCLANRRPYIARPKQELGARVDLSKARHLSFQLFQVVPNQPGKQVLVKYMTRYTRPRGLRFGRLAGPGWPGRRARQIEIQVSLARWAPNRVLTGYFRHGIIVRVYFLTCFAIFF